MKQLVIITAVCLSLSLQGQSIYKSSIDSGGASATAGNIQALYTIGEVFVAEQSAGNIILSEGFINQTESPGLSILENLWLNDIKVYPNPTKGILSINGDTSKIISIEIYSLLGAKLKLIKNDFREINLTAFENAVYFVKLNALNASKTIKIIKQ